LLDDVSKKWFSLTGDLMLQKFADFLAAGFLRWV